MTGIIFDILYYTLIICNNTNFVINSISNKRIRSIHVYELIIYFKSKFINNTAFYWTYVTHIHIYTYTHIHIHIYTYTYILIDIFLDYILIYDYHTWNWQNIIESQMQYSLLKYHFCISQKSLWNIFHDKKILKFKILES